MRLYNLNRLIRAYLQKDPKLSWDEAKECAIQLRRELERMDRNWTNNQDRFYNRGQTNYDPENYFGDGDFDWT